MSCPILLSSSLIVSSLRARCAGRTPHIEEMGHSLDLALLIYIEHMGGLKRPTSKERADAQAARKRNLRRKVRWDRREREDAERVANA